MWKSLIYTVLVEICLLGVGFLTFPNWMADNVEVWLPVAFVGLLVFCLYDNWPNFMTAWQRSAWTDLEGARRLFRDEADKLGLEEIVAEIDVWSDAVPENSGKAFAARKYILHGITQGVVVAKGVPKHGVARVAIPTDVAVRDETYKSRIEGVLIGKDGTVYEDVKILRRTVKKAARRFAENDQDFERREKG